MPFLSRAGSDVCIARILKVANRSIETWVCNAKGSLEVSNEEALEYPRRVAFIRDPLERLKSSFFMARWEVRQGHLWDNIPAEYLFIENRGIQKDYEMFLDYVFNNENNHWKPQTDLISHNGVLVPNIYHRMQDISIHYDKYFDEGTIPHLGAASRKEEPDYSYRLADIEKKWEQDFNLWRSLNGNAD